MPNGTPFQIALLFSIVAFFSVRAYYRSKTMGTLRPDAPSSRESKFIRMYIPIWGVVWLGMLIWLINPDWMIWSTLSLSEWLRWSGVGIVVIALALLIWVHQTLSTSFSGTLEIRERHKLITTGPYRRVRHPMYTAIFLWALGTSLITSNWFNFLFPLAFALFFILRAPNEEKMMVETFGDEYRAYMKQTGCFLPRLRKDG